MRVPVLVDGVVRRPRVERAIAARARDRPIVLVCAAAGSGKTTAVVQYLARTGGPAAWLSLDDGDGRPGRFVSYLAAALGRVDPAGGAEVTDLLEDGLPPEDCAAMLGERMPQGAVLVLDDVHEIASAPGVLRALRAFLRVLAPGRSAVLVSRRMPPLGLERDALASRVGGIFDHELAFTVDETAALLVARGVERDPASAHAATGGWAAALVFDSLPQGDDATVLPPGEDLLFSYLGAEIMDRLPAHLREVLPRTSVLDVVTPERLTTLLGDPAGARLFDELSQLRLPVTPEPGGMRYHPRLRAFLAHRLRAEQPEAVDALTARFARVMAHEGHLEEAVDGLLRSGRATEAEPLAERAVELVMRRGDWDKALAWSAALGDEAHRRRPALRRAQVRSLLLGRRQAEVEDLVHVMLASGEIGRLTVKDPDVVGWAVWALHGSGEWAKLLPLLPEGPTGRLHVARYLFATSAAPDPPRELPAEMLDRPQPLHVALQSALYYQGRLADVERLAEAAATRGPVRAALAQIYRIAALRERGHLGGARRALDAVAQRVRASRYREYWHCVEGELLFEEGRTQEGLERVRDARRVSREHAYRIGDRALFAAAEGKMLVRMGRPAEALDVLSEASAWCAQRGLLSFREWADTWLGAALLLLDEPPERTLAVLRPAVAGMDRGGRRLELPAGAVFLAEAEWRAGDEEAHDRAATLAHTAAERTGTLVPLLRALAVVPGVLPRRADAAGEDDPRWRSLLRAAHEPAAEHGPAPRVRVRTFGEPAIEVDGRPAPLRLSKMVEVAARVAGARDDGVPRERLVAELFGHSDDGANYLRQVIHRLRQVAPDGVELRSHGGRLRWWPAGVAVADDALFEALVARARLEVGERRAATLTRALRLAERGAYLAGSRDEAAAERRRDLEGLGADARATLVRALLEVGDPAQARRAARRAVADAPYSEDLWQLLMRAEAALAGAEAVAPVLLECRAALRQIDMEPCGATLRLVERLRA